MNWTWLGAVSGLAGAAFGLWRMFRAAQAQSRAEGERAHQARAQVAENLAREARANLARKAEEKARAIELEPPIERPTEADEAALFAREHERNKRKP